MKVGDMVKFHTNSWVFSHHNARYENPGIIIEDVSLEGDSAPRYRVLWANQKMTVEHTSYLQSADELTDEQLEQVRGGMSAERFELWRSEKINEV